MRQRLPYGSNADNRTCTYEIKEEDWKPDEGYAYDNDRSLNIVAKVFSVIFGVFADYSQFHRQFLFITI